MRNGLQPHRAQSETQNTAPCLHHRGLVPRVQREQETFREGKRAIPVFTGKVSQDQHLDGEVGRKQCGNSR